MANQPTIIIGSLNDAELKQSIDKLVEHVNVATRTMVTNFDQAVNEMKRKLQELGQIDVNIGLHGSSKTRNSGKKNISDETTQLKKESKELTTTLDQESTVIQKVTQGVQTYSSAIKQAADLVRSSKQWENGGFVSTIGGFGLSPENGIWSLAEKGSEKTVTVEQQLISLAERRKISEQEVLEIIQRETAEEQLQATVTNDQVSVKTKKRFQDYEQLRDAMAQVLGIERESVILADRRNASGSALSQSIKQMQQAYMKLNAEDRNSDMGRALLNNLHAAEAAAERIRRQMATPTSLDMVQILPEKSLNDITYKMKQYQSYQREIDLSNQKGRQEYQAVGQAIEDLKRRQDKLMGGQRGLLQSNNALTRSFNYMKNRLAFMFTVGGTTQFVKQLAQVRGEYEMTERALGVLVDSAQRGTKIFNELSQMALVSPYTLIELSNAAKQLVAYDVAARDVVDTTRRLADISAAVGAPVERLTYALGQIKAYEYLNSRDARIFANAGIPLVKQLSEYYSQLEGRLISVGDVYDRIKKKAVSYNDVMGVLTRMTDESGRFFDYQAKVADTLKVQLANLTLAWNNMLNQIGKQESGLLTGSIKALKNMFIQWKNIDRAVGNIIWSYGIMKGTQLIILTFEKKITNEKARELLLNEQLVKSYDKLKGKIATTAKSGYTWITMAVLLITSIGRAIAQAKEDVRNFNKAISEGAKEASKNLSEYLQSASVAETRALALDKALTPTDATKAWETIREEIENSSTAADLLIPQLMQIEDVNERVSAAFKMADSIRDAQNALSDLYDEMHVHDAGFLAKIFLGPLEQSPAQLVETYVENLKKTGTDEEGIAFLNRKHALRSVEIFVDQASNLIRENIGDKDPIQVTEAWTRILENFFATYPDMSKDARETFSNWANDLFAKEFGGVFDKAALAQKKFFDLLKKNSSTAFTNIYEGFIDEQGEFSVEQRKAIDDAAEKLGEEWKTIFWQSMNDAEGNFDSHKFERYLLSVFNAVDRNATQKRFDQLFQKSDNELFGVYRKYRVGNDEEYVAWEKRLADALENTNEAIEQRENMLQTGKQLDQDTRKSYQDDIKQLKDEAKAIEAVQTAFGLRKKDELDNNKKNKQGEGSIATAIKKEIDLIDLARKKYEKYRKLGLNETEALYRATNEYNNAFKQTNDTLKSFGLNTTTIDAAVKSSDADLSAFYNKQLERVNRLKDATQDWDNFVQKSINTNYDIEENFYAAVRALVVKNESFREKAYHLEGEFWDKAEKDPKYTIGYGFTTLMTEGNRRVKEGDEITLEQAEEEIKAQLKYRLSLIRALFETYGTEMKLTKEQIQSYLDFQFQSGGGPQALLQEAQGDMEKLGKLLETGAYNRLNEKQVKEYGKGVLARDKERAELWVSGLGDATAKPMAEAFDEIMNNFDDEANQTVVEMGKTIDRNAGKLNELIAEAVADKAPAAIEYLDKAIADYNFADVEKEYQDRLKAMGDMITLVKDMYELDEEMSKSPALSSVFADMLGLSDEDVQLLPHKAEDVIERINNIIQDTWAKDPTRWSQEAPNILDVLNLSNLDDFINENNITGEFETALRNAVKVVNDIRLKEAQDQIEEWNKLLEKYAEYEYKRTEIIKEAQREREVAAKNGAGEDVQKAIDKKERRELAGLDFEQFQQSATWITATGDLATLADDALLTLIQRLEEYKDKARDLDPKQIKRINDALRKMHKELRKGNPFRAIIETIEDAKARTEDYEMQIQELSEERMQLFAKQVAQGFLSEDEMKRYDQLGKIIDKLKEEMQEIGEISPEALTGAINDSIAVVRTATNETKELMSALGGKNATEAIDKMERVMAVIESAGKGAAIGAQFSAWGAVIGAIAGGLKGIIVQYVDILNGNRDITTEIENSRRAVTRLGQSYDQLAWEADKAYGVMSSGLQGVTAANKKLQLAELERQLALEQSRKSKNKDEDEIVRLQGEIAGLRREIQDTTDDAINQLLGISDWGGQIESLVQTMIDAFRNGEDAMQAFSDKWDEMVDNIILKLIVSELIQEAWDGIRATMNAKRDEITAEAETNIARAEAIGADINKDYELWKSEKGYYGLDPILKYWDEFSKEFDEWKKKKIEESQGELESVEINYAKWLKEFLMGDAKSTMENVLGGPVMEAIKDAYTFGENNENQLSLLQQGIQGITEETAGALEGYMNGVSQQVYLHSSILSQIRDAIVTPESGIEEQLDLMRQAAGLSEDEAVKSDLQMGVMSQMLLQLQASYQMQGAIYSMLNGWSNADGQSVRVTMIS